MQQSFIRSLFGFGGRMNRLRFFLRLLFLIVFIIVLYFLLYFVLIITTPIIVQLGIVGAFLGLLMLLIMMLIIPILFTFSWYSLYVKRIHDIGLSGLWILALFLLWLVSCMVEIGKIMQVLPYIRSGSEYEVYMWALNYETSTIAIVSQNSPSCYFFGSAVLAGFQRPQPLWPQS